MNLLTLNINSKFERILWFNHIFLNYEILTFYKIKNPRTTEVFEELKTLITEGYSFKIFHSGLNLFYNDSYNLLKTKFLVVYTNNVQILSRISEHMILFSVSMNRYYINPIHLVNIHNIYKFFGNNYLYFVHKALYVLYTLYRLIIYSIRALVYAPNQLLIHMHTFRNTTLLPNGVANTVDHKINSIKHSYNYK